MPAIFFFFSSRVRQTSAVSLCADLSNCLILPGFLEALDKGPVHHRHVRLCPLGAAVSSSWLGKKAGAAFPYRQSFSYSPPIPIKAGSSNVEKLRDSG